MPKGVLHIKRRTEGTSNELSFDVLDAASKQLDEKQKKGRITKAGVQIPRGPGSQAKGTTLSSAQTKSALSPQEEIDRRKKKRKSQSFWLHFVVAFILIGGIAAGVWYGVNFYNDMKDYSSRFSALVDKFIEVDAEIVQLDTVMADPMSNIEAANRDELRKSAQAAAASLEAMKNDAEALRAMTDNERDSEALDQVIVAIDGRLEMVEQARTAIGLVETSGVQAKAANDAWGVVVLADQHAREAAEIANEAYTQEATMESREKTQEALAEFNDALGRLRQIDEMEKDVDFSGQIAYLEKRIESMEYAIATSDALLEGNRELAQEQNAAYNEADQEAARLASGLPASLEDPVSQAYGKRVEEVAQAYEKTRLKVTEADAFVRDYLGEQGK